MLKATQALWITCPHCGTVFKADPSQNAHNLACIDCAQPLRWFCVRNKQKYGPIPFRQLQEDAWAEIVLPADMLLLEGTTKWIGADSISGLFAARRPPAPLPASGVSSQISSANNARLQGDPSAAGDPLSRCLPGAVAEDQDRSAVLVTPPVFVASTGPAPSPLAKVHAEPAVPLAKPVSTTRRLLLHFQTHQRRRWLAAGAMALVALGMAGSLWLYWPKPPAAVQPQDVYQRTLKAVCFVVAPTGGDGKTAEGSGVLVDANRRWILTNHHVVRPRTTEPSVFFPAFRDGKLINDPTFYLTKPVAIKGKVIADDPKRDLALIELEFLPFEASEMKLAEKSPSPGQRVHTVGNPSASGALWVYTSGNVRQVIHKRLFLPDIDAASGKLLATGFTMDALVVETTNPINPGDSGGPVVNDSGELVAVNSSTRLLASLMTNAIDVTEVQALLREQRKR